MSKTFQSLAEKVQADYEEYINNLRKTTIDKVIEANYETYWKKAIVNCINSLAERNDEDTELCEYGDDVRQLLSVEHPLDFIYEEWVNEYWFDDSEEDLLSVIKEAAKMAQTHFFK